MIAKRIFDVIASVLGLVVLAPLFIAIAIAIKWDSSGPIFFRQERVGRFGKSFLIHKFRTMSVDAERQGLQITVGADPRVTRVGGFLRQYKLDELAQLLDVLLGSMSFVGPRPEVPAYVACYSVDVAQVILSVRPGITDRASIEYKDENKILAQASDPHKAYIEEVLPVKIEYYLDYVKNRSFLGDLAIIVATLFAIVR
jgi:lipopolysaccharide/colanic/teichoic acid biosynthesis glycosyltransferase